MPRAGIQADQDEACQVPVDLRVVSHTVAIPAEGASHQGRGWLPGQMPLPGFGLGRQPNRDRAINFALLPTPPKGGSQDDKFAPRGGWLNPAASVRAYIGLTRPPLHVFHARRAGY